MKQSFDLFINFDGNCREAMEFYAKVFKSEVQYPMTYAETPPDADFEVAEADKDRIMYANVPIYGCNVMFSDVPSGMEFIKGNNISPTVGTDDIGEIKRVFSVLSEGGTIEMELQKTVWSQLYGMVTDKFGVIWQVSHIGEEMEAFGG